MSDLPIPSSSKHSHFSQSEAEPSSSHDPLILLDECLASLPEGDSRIPLLYRIRHLLLQDGATRQQRDAELGKLKTVVEKLTAPANRIGTLLALPGDGNARIMVGGSEFYANVDPRLDQKDLKIGVQVLVNEAYVLINTLDYDRTGPIMKIKEVLDDGRIRIDQEPGRPGTFLQRSSDLKDLELKAGDEVRLDPTHRFAVERLEHLQTGAHVLDEVPSITWENIGGQHEAIASIRRAIEYPLLHAETFKQYQFTQPKGFLLYGPPGCGKTMIGQATAASLAQLMNNQKETNQKNLEERGSLASRPVIAGGVFLHVKGPEILNMWVGESERMVRDLFTQARQRRMAGFLPFIFIDEAESILGTRRSLRSYNLSNTLVPMFCAELDGIESLRDVVVILASNRPDLIDPAVLRPGRIDRKMKVSRPGRQEAMEILRIYFSPDVPLDEDLVDVHHGDRQSVCDDMLGQVIERVFQRNNENRVLSVRLRNGKRDVLYRSDLLSGAVLAGIVRRAKERAIERTIEGHGNERAGVRTEDLLASLDDEFHEGEILPPDNSAEEWLKLLDHHPDQVVGISSFRKGSVSEERVVQNIV